MRRAKTTCVYGRRRWDFFFFFRFTQRSGVCNSLPLGLFICYTLVDAYRIRAMMCCTYCLRIEEVSTRVRTVPRSRRQSFDLDIGLDGSMSLDLAITDAQPKLRRLGKRNPRHRPATKQLRTTCVSGGGGHKMQLYHDHPTSQGTLLSTRRCKTIFKTYRNYSSSTTHCSK